MRGALAAALALLSGPAFSDQSIPDQYPGSPLYRKPVEVIPGVFSAIGATAPPTYENAGHNNNLSFILTGDGVVVVNSGANDALAAALHEEIRAVTDEPVRLVVAENGQGHAMGGNGYWADLGVPILAHEDAAEAFADRGPQILSAMLRYARETGEGSRIEPPTRTFADREVIEMGGRRIEVLHLGPAHSPGDTQVWLPDESLMLTGDLAFHERLPPIFEETCTACWLETWDEAFEPMGVTYVIPGHGHPTNVAQVRRYTRDYLIWLRARIGALLEAGGSLEEAYYVDQSPFSHLDTFEELAARNAGNVFVEMEFE